MSSFLVLSEGDTRNRWCDGQVCPDVGQGTIAPWTRRLGRKKDLERMEGRRIERRWQKRRKGVGGRERERGARLVWRKGLSPEIGVKKTMNAGGVENRID
ncbi:hypothetical protein TNCV_1038071 [Trichonephila clavipes]|nr:hypothetical protein TNCV_1038071 [Trichonephila clavipes]